MPDDVSADEVDALRDEIRRLRAELAAAAEAARVAEHRAGELRGELIETYRALDRATQIEAALRTTYGGRAFRIARRARDGVDRLLAAVVPSRPGR